MTNSSIWQLSFKIKYKYYYHFEAFLDLISDSASISNHDTETIEINPEDIWQVDAYFEDKPNFDIIVSKLEKIAKINDIILKDMTYYPLEDQDWVSIVQEKFKPFSVGRFFISSNHYKDECPPDKSSIILEAACAFGTGEHATTKLCIEAEEFLKDLVFFNILDMGTGTGILAIAAKNIWPNAKIIGCDIDPLATEIAKNNASINNTEGIIFIPSDGYTNIELQFDLIISNILAQPLIHFAPHIKNHCLDDGYIILSGFLKSQADDVIGAHKKVGFKLVKTLSEENWVTAIMQKGRI
jgi:ribosomal protein L11 methyltransferase